jgi:hypothetical protein
LQPFLASGNGGSIAFVAGSFESPVDQPAQVLLSGAVNLWINGQLVPTSEKSPPIRLKAGRNEAVLKLASGRRAPGFSLTILSEKELRPAEDAIK